MSDPNRIGVLQSEELEIVPKGWGWERVLWNNEDYCCKELFFFHGKKCSWHYHEKKDETFRILMGRLLIDYSMEDCLYSNEIINNMIVKEPDDRLNFQLMSWSIVEPGDVFHIPRGLRHRMTGMTDCLFIEVSTQHFEEDSIRLVKGN